jgi:hypothetical protein
MSQNCPAGCPPSGERCYSTSWVGAHGAIIKVWAAAADPDMTANPDSELEFRNRLRFEHLQQHRSTSDIDDISIIMTAFPSSIHRLPEVIGPKLLNTKIRNATLGHGYVSLHLEELRIFSYQPSPK